MPPTTCRGPAHVPSFDALKQDYANRVGALEARINQLEAAQGASPVRLAAAAPAPGPPRSRGECAARPPSDR